MSEGRMSPEQAEQAIWAFFWQVSRSRDRRKVMTPDEVAAMSAEAARGQSELEISLASKIQRVLAKVFTGKRREEVQEGATKDALAELEAAAGARVGRVNQATGLPESEVDLASGRDVVSGEDLCMSMLVPPFALAAATVAWLPDGKDPAKDENWQVMAYKPVKRICMGCNGLRREKGPRCKECNGKGRRKVGAFLSKTWDMCGPCQGHGVLLGPVCGQCKGAGTIENWSQEEHETVRANSHMISQTVTKLAAEGLFNAKPIDKNDAEMGDLVWEDDRGDTLGFKLTWKGFKHMQEYIDKRPELKRHMHMLVHAGDDVRSQAPEWAVKEYQASAR